MQKNLFFRHWRLSLWTLVHLVVVFAFLNMTSMDIGAYVYIADIEPWVAAGNILLWVIVEAVDIKTGVVGKTERSNMKTALKRIFLTAGVIVFICGVLGLANRVWWNYSHEVTTAEIVTEKIPHYNYVQYLNKAKFTVNGEEYLAELTYWQKDSSPGERVKVIYEKNRPINCWTVSSDNYKRPYGSSLATMAVGLVIVFVCRKGAKGYFKDWILKHKLLLSLTLLHLLLVLFEILGDGWDAVFMAMYVEWWLVPLNIILWIILPLNDGEENEYGEIQ